MTEVGTLSFSISGEVITNLARKMWAGGELDNAFSLLANGIGMTNKEQAFELMIGKYKLVDDCDGVKFVKDNPKIDPIPILKKRYYRYLVDFFWKSLDSFILPDECKKALNYSLELARRKDIQEIDDNMVLIIELFGDADVTFELDGLKGLLTPYESVSFPRKIREPLLEAWNTPNRATVHHNTMMYYMAIFLEECINITRFRIAMGERGLLESSNQKDAIKKTVHSIRTETDALEENLKESIKKTKKQKQVYDNYMAQKGIKPTEPSSMWDILDAMKKDAAAIFAENFGGKEGPGRTGWITPEGVFHECEITEHIQFTEELFKKGIAPSKKEKDLERLGWLRLTASRFWFKDKDKLTNRQRDFIYDFVVKYKMVKVLINGDSYFISDLFKAIGEK